MKKYIVGGWVRDRLLAQQGRAVLPADKDWVVVGADVDRMIREGFIPVGKDFPVFLHPRTHEEYALARTERKSGKGYRGFTVYADPSVTLEEDLLRRDLTINAIAQDEEGRLFDPYRGREDLQKKVLRHVSPAFAEDPVRVLRAARFAAKLPDFRIADETLGLMVSMVQSGETDALVPERVTKELFRSLKEERPSRFFSVLKACGYLQKAFPHWSLTERTLAFAERVKKQVATPDSDGACVASDACSASSVRPASDTSSTSSARPASNTCSASSVGASSSCALTFAALFLETPADVLDGIFAQLKVPKYEEELARLFVGSLASDSFEKPDPESALNWLRTEDALRRPERFEHLLVLLEASGKMKNRRFWHEAACLLRNTDLRSAVARIEDRSKIPGKVREIYLEQLSRLLQEQPLNQSAALSEEDGAKGVLKLEADAGKEKEALTGSAGQ